jgi:hypothetical protein
MALMRNVLDDLNALAKKDLTPIAIELGRIEYEEGVGDYLIQELPTFSRLFGFPVKLRKGVQSGRFYLFSEKS